VDTAGTRSLAVATPGVRVKFSGNSNTVHTRTSLVFPAGAANMPFTTEPRKGGDSVNLTTPGLYVFTCGIHPYMFGAVIVDDPATAGLDLGNAISLINGITVPIATGMMPDASKYYVANLLDSSITVIDMNARAVINSINLIANYNRSRAPLPARSVPCRFKRRSPRTERTW
jgi:YVTN family beta-propeller protein